MKPAINPFRQLYVGESVGPDEFVKLFSPVLVTHSLALFQPGNVVLKGFTGAGKSMLLNLLLPEIRLAYERLAQKFPIPEQFSRFIGAGINLQTSGVAHFGNRPIQTEENKETNTSPIFFGDFLNYYVVSDLISSICKYVENDKLSKEIGIASNKRLYDEFARLVSVNDCWFGSLEDVNTFKDLRSKLAKRIVDYKTFLNFNTPVLSQKIIDSKTIIGEPISVVADLLKRCGILKKDVQIFIRVDQYEELIWLGAKNGLGELYQEMIHKLLGIRNSSVSYRIGTRHFAWADEKKMFGTTAPLEKRRTYLEFHIDNEMRRKENARTWIFPKLAEDIFSRRLISSGFNEFKTKKDVLKNVFGASLTPKESALIYFPGEKKDKAVDLESEWPIKWQNFLLRLAKKDPFDARLAEAWSRQRGKEEIMNTFSSNKPFPWDKIYWKKERTEQALMQLASRNQQQLNWSGKEDLLGLSGGNILAFLNLCQHIWDVWLRDNRYEQDKSSDISPLDTVIQSVGIIEASTDWYNELAMDERGGKNRKQFINFLGTLFFKTLIEDKAMSNPGHNGFSVDLDELEKSKLNPFLKECADYGDLYDSSHTSKLKDKRKRWKFYLNPILSPYFKIPYVHTKEPIYISLGILLKWISSAEIYLTIEDKISDNNRRNLSKRKQKGDNHNLKFDF